MRALLRIGLCLVTTSMANLAQAQVDPAAAIAEARAQIDAIDPDSAAKLLQGALDINSGASDRQRIRAFVLLGITNLLVEGREVDARRAFRLALQLDPEHRVDSLAHLSGDLLRVFNAERVALGPRPAAPPGQQTILDIRGLPDGARLSVDGAPWQAPRGSIGAGVHRIEVSARGHEFYRDTVAVREGTTTVKTVQMARAAPATLSVTSEPWGRVSLDGRLIGETPIIEQPVDAGVYRLVMESPGRPAVTQQVVLQSGTHLRLPLLGGGAEAARSPFPFTTADSLYRSTMFEEALPIYQRVLRDTTLTLADERRAEAATRIGMIFYATARSQNLGAYFDSAQTYFRAAYALEPAYLPAPGDLAPELRSAIDVAREGSFRLAADAPRDTSVSATDGRFRVLVRPPRPAQVAVRIIAAEGGRVVFADAQLVEGTRAFDWNVGAGMAEAIPLGTHTLLIQATDSAGEPSPTIEYRLDVTREAADTTPMPAPILESSLLPETEPVGRGWHLLRGIVFGAMAAAIPVYAAIEFSDAQPAFSAGGFVVGGALALGGIIGFLKGEPVRPVPANIERNRLLREEDARNRERIADANRAARSAARVRVHAERIR